MRRRGAVEENRAPRSLPFIGIFLFALGAASRCLLFARASRPLAEPAVRRSRELRVGAGARVRRLRVALAPDARPGIPFLSRSPSQGLRVDERGTNRAGGAREPVVRPRRAHGRDSLREARRPRRGNPPRVVRSRRARGRQLLGGELRGVRSRGGTVPPGVAEDSRRCRSRGSPDRRGLRRAAHRAPFPPRGARRGGAPRRLATPWRFGAHPRGRRPPRPRARGVRLVEGCGPLRLRPRLRCRQRLDGQRPRRRRRPERAPERSVGTGLRPELSRAGVPPAGEEVYFTRKAVRRAVSDPSGLGRVVLSKLVWLTQAEEPRDNHAFAFFLDQSGFFALLPGFGILLALAVASAFVWRSLRGKELVLLWLVAGAGPFVAALAGLRYRMPIVPPVALLAGAGTALLLDRIRARDPRLLAAPAAAFVLTLLASHVDKDMRPRRLRRGVDAGRKRVDGGRTSARRRTSPAESAGRRPRGRAPRGVSRSPASRRGECRRRLTLIRRVSSNGSRFALGALLPGTGSRSARAARRRGLGDPRRPALPTSFPPSTISAAPWSSPAIRRRRSRRSRGRSLFSRLKQPPRDLLARARERAASAPR